MNFFYGRMLTGSTATPGVATSAMMGLARLSPSMVLTPASSGDIQCQISGQVVTTSTIPGQSWAIMYGTGTAPSYLAPVTGTTLTSNQTSFSSTSNTQFPFSLGGIASNLAIGTQYWFDLAAFDDGTMGGVEGYLYELGGGQLGATGAAGPTGPTGAISVMPFTAGTGPGGVTFSNQYYTMLGYGSGPAGWAYQMKTTTAAQVSIGGSIDSLAGTIPLDFQMFMGTGAAPSWGVTASGNYQPLGPTGHNAIAGSSPNIAQMFLQGRTGNMIVGATYWFDLAVKMDGGGTGVFYDPYWTILELAGAGQLGTTGPIGPTGPVGIAANDFIGMTAWGTATTMSLSSKPTFLMGGFGNDTSWALTPQSSGDVLIGVGCAVQLTTGRSLIGKLKYGTGTAPVRSGGETGIADATQPISFTDTGAGADNENYVSTAVIKGLQAGTRYWFDAAFAGDVGFTLTLGPVGNLGGLTTWAMEIGGGPTGPTGPINSTGPTGPTGPVGSGVQQMLLVSYTGTTASTAGTNVAVPWNTITTDVQSAFDQKSGKYTPTIAGWYTFTAYPMITAAGGNACEAYLMKNSTTPNSAPGTVICSYSALTGANFVVTMPLTATVFMNGTTDFVCVMVNVGGTLTIGATDADLSTNAHILMNFQAQLLQPGATGFTGATGAASTVTGPTGFGATGTVFLSWMTGNTSNGGGAGVTGMLNVNNTQVDTANGATGGGYRPNAAGWYQVQGVVSVGSYTNTSGSPVCAVLVKNGLVIAQGSKWATTSAAQSGTSAGTPFAVSVVDTIVFLNGSTDFLQLGYYSDVAGLVLSGTGPNTQLSAFAVPGFGQTGPTGFTGPTGPTGAPTGVPSYFASTGFTSTTGPTGSRVIGNIIENWGMGVHNFTALFGTPYNATGPNIVMTPKGATAIAAVLNVSKTGFVGLVNPTGQFFWHAIGT